MEREHTARPGVGTRRSGRASRRAAAFAVWYLRAVAFINFLSAVWVSLGQDVRRHNQENLFTPYLLTAGFASGAFTMFLAVTMRRRKRAAGSSTSCSADRSWWLFAFAMVFPEIRQYAQNWVSLVLTAAFVGSLLTGRREFYAKGDRANPRLAAVVAVGGLLAASLLATLLVTVTNTAQDAGRSTFAERWRYGTLRLVSVAGDRAHRRGSPRPTGSTSPSTSSARCWSSPSCTPPSAPGAPSTRSARTTRRGCGRCSNGTATGTRSRYFALRRDKSVIWSPTGKAAVAYRVVGGVSLASGDPLGDPEAWPGAIEPWLAEARAHGWMPAVMGASEEAGTVYTRHGLDALELGDEAVVDVAEFTLEGRAMRTVRQACNG